ncbi:class F sortase [Streptomyces niveus]|uniref:class F sortase n=1 Tax=Streptomyces niveus TaxID=193462 RepID=UPI0036AAA6AE
MNSPQDPPQVGWFEGGPLPGRTGLAVVVGRADSLDGPAVFADLSLLRWGDVITIGLDNGGTVRFDVSSAERHAKDRFPTEAVCSPPVRPAAVPDHLRRHVHRRRLRGQRGRLRPPRTHGLDRRRARHRTRRARRGDDRTPPRPPL